MVNIFKHSLGDFFFKLSTTDLVGRSSTSEVLEQVLLIGMLINLQLMNTPINKTCSSLPTKSVVLSSKRMSENLHHNTYKLFNQ